MAADYKDKSENPFCIMVQLQIASIKKKVTSIDSKIEENKSKRQSLNCKQSKIEGTLNQVKEILGNILE